MELLFKAAIEQQLFIDLDWHVGQLLANQSQLIGKNKNKLLFLICFLSAEMRSGHVCIPLQRLDSGQFFYGYKQRLAEALWQQLGKPTAQDWAMLLNISGIVSGGETNTPLILQSGLLYFQRMWRNEQKVAAFFQQTAHVKLKPASHVTFILDKLFGETGNGLETDWQKIAVALALTRQVAIISGGPGTGKTTTVAKLLAALLLMKSEEAPSLRIMTAAPTGKAAARLTESLNQAMTQLLNKKQIGLSLPKEAVTLHRLLVAQRKQSFLYHKNNPLHVDILIIDEASMVDLSMMAAIIDALPANARLILLGDREQLSSVEAGAVLGDLCRFFHGNYSKSRANEINYLTGYKVNTGTDVPAIADNICLLQKSYRFDKHSGIGLLANYIRQGKSRHALQLLQSNAYADIEFHTFSNNYSVIVKLAAERYCLYLQTIIDNNNDIPVALAVFEQFRLLAALREGKYGVNGLNQEIEKTLIKWGYIKRSHHDDWYLGRPVMILKNDSGLQLYNGDIGITLPVAGNHNKKRVYFQLADGTLRGFPPYLLPEHETAFVMTVHKSQGSEFTHAALILPDEYTPLLTRSLLYTAVTRAKQKITIYSNASILVQTIDSQIERCSGLGDILAEIKQP